MPRTEGYSTSVVLRSAVRIAIQQIKLATFSSVGHVIPSVESSLTSVVVITLGSAYHQTAAKTRHSFIHSFRFTAAPALIISMVNCGSHELNLFLGGTEHGILELPIGKVQQHHHYSYETASGSVEVANS